MINIIKDLMLFTRGYNKSLITAFIYSFIFTVFDVLTYFGIILTLKYVMIAFTSQENISLTAIQQITLVMLASLLGKLVFGSLANAKLSITCFNICNDKRIAIGNRLKMMPMGYFHNNKVGEIVSTLTTAINDIEDQFPMLFTNIIVGLFHAVLITIMLLLMNRTIGLIAIIALIVGLFINGLLQKKSKIVSPKRQAAQHHLVSAVMEYVEGISVIKAFNLGAVSSRRVDKAISESCKKNTELEAAVTRILSMYLYSFKLFSCLILLVTAFKYIEGDLSIYNFMIMLVSSFMIFSSIEKLGGAAAFLQMFDVSLTKIREMDKVDLLTEGALKSQPTNFDIQFKNVSFAYEDKRVIKSINLKIKENQTVAFVGPSGSGKSTICHLLARFWEVDKGSITIGGINIEQFNYDCLMSFISIVSQKVYLFEDTIINNIRFANLSASTESIYRAAEKACCHDFIMALPKGYNTMVKEGGKSLSGGEKQRIAIARAILKDAPIIILDEATSSVDPINEVLIHQAVEALTVDKTVIMVAHQLSTIQNSDQIFVLNDGEIIQRGQHKTLLKEKGLYKEFVDVRNQAYSWQL